MRPYRAIPIDGKDFVYGWYFELDGMSFIENQAEKSNNRCTVEVIPETVGQSTGLKDKNGKEGYAGDKAVTVADKKIGNNIVYVIIWNDKKAAFALKSTKRFCLSLRSLSSMEIIGNVHQPKPEEKPK